MTIDEATLVCDILDKYIREQRRQAASDRRDASEYWQLGKSWDRQDLYSLGDTFKRYAEQREAETDEAERIMHKIEGEHNASRKATSI